MAKQGSIRHYRQEGDAKAPESLPYGELAVAKDGTVYAGNEEDTPVELATAEEVSAAKNAATAAMPQAGGTFTGDVVAYATNRDTSGGCLRNCVVVSSGSSPTANLVSTNCLVFSRA